MADQFVAEIRIVGFNFAPKGWATCDGQLLPISQNTALFALLGIYYGGDGKSTFALPDLQGSAPMHQGVGAGLTDRYLGEASGVDTVTLLETEIPAHTHTAMAHTGRGTKASPLGNAWAVAGTGRQQTAMYGPSAATTQMNALALGLTGGSFPHNNMPPYLVLNFVIAMSGIFPARS